MKANRAPTRIYPPAPHPAVGAVVFKDDAVLLVKRANPPAQGFWAIPGGSVHLGETLQAAAEREVMEETRVAIRAGEPIFVFDVIDKDEAGVIKHHYVIVDLVAAYISGEPEPGDDAVAARWVSEEMLADLNVNRLTRRLLWDHFNFGKPAGHGGGVDRKIKKGPLSGPSDSKITRFSRVRREAIERL